MNDQDDEFSGTRLTDLKSENFKIVEKDNNNMVQVWNVDVVLYFIYSQSQSEHKQKPPPPPLSCQKRKQEPDSQLPSSRYASVLTPNTVTQQTRPLLLTTNNLYLLHSQNSLQQKRPKQSLPLFHRLTLPSSYHHHHYITIYKNISCTIHNHRIIQ